jgi:hypothetical protein
MRRRLFQLWKSSGRISGRRAQSVPAGRDSPLADLKVMFLACGLAHAGPMPDGVQPTAVDNVGIKTDDGRLVPVPAKLSCLKLDELLDTLDYASRPAHAGATGRSCSGHYLERVHRRGGQSSARKHAHASHGASHEWTRDSGIRAFGARHAR